MELSNEFTLRLLSDSSTNYFPDNNNSEFSTRFNIPFKLDSNIWEMALTEINFPNNIYTLFKENIKIFVITKKKQMKLIRDANVPPTECKDLEKLVFYLNQIMNKILIFAILEKEGERLLQLKVKSNYLLVIDDTLKDILSFDQNRFIGSDETTYQSSSRPALNRRIDHLYVYSNIGEYVLVGEIRAPLLRTFPFIKKQFGLSSTSIEFKQLLFVDVEKSHINQIDIIIRDDAGQIIPFVPTTEPTALVIRFRKKRV